MLVSVVIPVYNEISTLAEIIRRVTAVDFPKEIVLVDDCSRDGSRELLERLGTEGLAVVGGTPRNRNDVRVLLQEKNQGKGSALRRAFAESSGDILIVQDADLEYDPRDIPRVIQPILDGVADVVFGSRFTGTPRRVLYYWHSVINHLLTTLSNMSSNLNLTDMETCYKAFRAEVIRSVKVEEDRFGFEPEITAKVARGGWRVFGCPSATTGGPTRRARRSAGRTACAPSTSSASTPSSAEPPRPRGDRTRASPTSPLFPVQGWTLGDRAVGLTSPFLSATGAP
jgi:glycosyltransferase involved in cell wall biosynthesis